MYSISARRTSAASCHRSPVAAPLVPRALPGPCIFRLHAGSFSCSGPRVTIARASASDVEVKEVPLGKASEASENDDSIWVPVCLPEELPKGVRKEVEVDGRQVLMFWYRNQIYAIEGRSPAEGAYSEGFIAAKFTQDYCIECPATGTLFSLKDGSIQSWYPNNPVLRAITPQDTCRPMEIYPVKLTQQAICVNISKSTTVATRSDRGGAGTSIENNNVFTVQPNVYFEGMDPSKEQASLYQTGPPPVANPAIAATAILATGAAVVVGCAAILYLLGTS